MKVKSCHVNLGWTFPKKSESNQDLKAENRKEHKICFTQPQPPWSCVYKLYQTGEKCTFRAWILLTQQPRLKLPPFAGNMENIEIPNFNCLKRRWSAGRGGLDFALGKSPAWLNQHKGEMKKNGLQERIPWLSFMHIKSNTDKFHPYLAPEVAQLQAALFLGWNSWVCPKHTWLALLWCKTQNKCREKTVAGFPVGMWHELNCTVLLRKLV